LNLIRSGQDVRTIFDLLGSKENDMTFSLGWVLLKSEAFLEGMLLDAFGKCPWKLDKAVIKLQTGRGADGITDVEVEIDESMAMIIEAKRGPTPPSTQQLNKYARVLNQKHGIEKRLVALTNASSTAAKRDLVCEGLKRSEIHHMSWRRTKQIAEDAVKHENNDNKRWLRDFVKYLGGLLEMEMLYSNRVFVVSLAGVPEGWSISYKDIVEKKARYFFQVGKGWPDPPPNYMAFRYDGKLQSIHHVEGYETFTRPRQIFKEAPSNVEWPLNYCLRLGPAIRPPHEVRNGPRINHSARTYCLLDTLLTNKTISDALTETENRVRKNLTG
jgi:hypothetical protein